MAAPKGHTKYGGRSKGTPNKKTADIKQAFQELIENNLDNMTKWLNEIAKNDPAKALTLIKDLSEYILPKQARQDVTLNTQPEGVKIIIQDVGTEGTKE